MKRTVSLMLAIVLTFGMLFSLASCGGGISGSYQGKVDIMVASYTVTYKFNGNNVEVVSEAEALGGLVEVKPQSISGTYTLGETENGTKTITFTFGDGEAKGAAEAGVALPFEQGDGYIKIAGIKYNKV